MRDRKLSWGAALSRIMTQNGNAIHAIIDRGKETMISEKKIRILLEDIKTVYLVGYFKDDLTTEAEKWGQIEILERILLDE